MSAQGTTDAVGAHTAPGYSMQDLLAAGAAASAICTPPREAEPSADHKADHKADDKAAAQHEAGEEASRDAA